MKVSNLQEIMALLVFCTAQLKNQTKEEKKQTDMHHLILKEESKV